MIKRNKGIKRTIDATDLDIRDLDAASDSVEIAPQTAADNVACSIEELDSTVSSNSGTQLNVTQFDSSGNEIGAHLTSDGDYHLGVQMQQDVQADPNNSSVANLVFANSYTFTGTSTSTLGVVGLQWSLNTDQNATVCIDQSPDGTNWDLTDCFEYIESHGGDGGTVQALNSYWRIRVILTGTTDTTYFRLQGVLCPIAEPLPRALSLDGRQQTQTTISGRENTSRHVWVNPTNELATSPVYRLVGTAFDNDTIDTNFWTPALVNGSVTQGGGAVTLQTSAAINSSAKLVSVRSGRFVAGSAQLFSCGIGADANPIAGNTRRIGPYDTKNGFYFEFEGLVFSIGSRKDGVDTLVSSGDFNGTLGASWEPAPGSHHLLSIEYTPLMTAWYVGGRLLHTKTIPHLSDTLTLPITIENINTTNNTDIDFQCVGAYIARQGELETSPTSKYQSGTTAEVICKRGAGVIRGIVLSAITANAVLIIYDGTVAAGSVIWNSGSMGNKIEPYHIDFFNLPFSTGLSFAITTQDANMIIIYE